MIESYSKKVNKKVKIIVRLHPNIQEKANLIKYSDCILNGSIFPDMQKLVIACDCLISDYSSTLFEFIYLGKPSFVYAPDYAHFNSTRGLIENYLDMPFIYSFSNENLIENIINFDLNEYMKRVEEFTSSNLPYGNGDASYFTANWLKSKMDK